MISKIPYLKKNSSPNRSYVLQISFMANQVGLALKQDRKDKNGLCC